MHGAQALKEIEKLLALEPTFLTIRIKTGKFYYFITLESETMTPKYIENIKNIWLHEFSAQEMELFVYVDELTATKDQTLTTRHWAPEANNIKHRAIP